jgi:hypothetical protein
MDDEVNGGEDDEVSGQSGADKTKFLCEICDNSYQSVKVLTRHKLQHNDDMPYMHKQNVKYSACGK